MLLLQIANDTITMSELTKVINEANETSPIYYILTAVITITGSFIGIYLGLFTSKRQVYSGNNDTTMKLHKSDIVHIFHVIGKMELL